LTLQVEWQEGHPAHKTPAVVPVSLSFVRVPAHPDYPGLNGHKTVVVVDVTGMIAQWLLHPTHDQ